MLKQFNKTVAKFISGLFLFSLQEIASKQVAPYGSWKSPITAASLTQGAKVRTPIAIRDHILYCLEYRPQENGRVTLVAWNGQNSPTELTPQPYYIRTRVHEYGGGELLISSKNIYFINDADQQIYQLKNDGTVIQITTHENARFADGCEHPTNGILYYVMEHHTNDVINSLVSIDPVTGTVAIVASGNDFYSSPRISPDGSTLSYVTWNHPNLPWDATQLWTIDLSSGMRTLIAGNGAESIMHPSWSPSGKLFYISDRMGWYNIYKAGNDQPVWCVNAECTMNVPWNFGNPSYVFVNGEDIVCSPVYNGMHKGLVYLRCKVDGSYSDEYIPLDFTTINSLCVDGSSIIFAGRSAYKEMTVVSYDLQTKAITIIEQENKNSIDYQYISVAQPIEFPTTDGKTAHAFYYPPCNPEFTGTEGELPPLLVCSHGGPTAHVTPGYNSKFFYWTSRGFAVLDVNYGGSSGYGTEYRKRLNSQWGVVDVDDCTNAALYCIEKGMVDKNRITIQGGSAGGFTTLAVLAFKDIFKCGANYFGVTDLEPFVFDTHKFEARYLDSLIGPYPEQKELYKARSPRHHVHKITCPVITFQGDEDKIVPPSQSEVMYKSLLERGIPTAYVVYKGEQHGFRKAENIKHALETQLYFFSQILGFPLSEDIEPIEIKNF